MNKEIKAYAIYNITKELFFDKSNRYSGGRRHMIYGDLRSARRMMNHLKRLKEFKNDELRIVELVPKIEIIGDSNE